MPESEASGSLQETYSEIRQALGVPYVPALFQAYGVYPGFLKLHWRAMQPVVETQEFFDLAGRLRADSYTRIHNYFRIPDMAACLAGGFMQEALATVDLLHYTDSLLLLFAAAQFQTFESPVGENRGSSPAAHPVFHQCPVFVEPDAATPGLRHVYDDIRRTLEPPLLSADYTALGHWPDFLSVYWKTLKPVVQSPLYEGCQHAVRDTAFALATEFPARVEVSMEQFSEMQLSDDDITSVARITEFFVNDLSRSLLNVALAKIGIEGGTRGMPSPEEPRGPKPQKVGEPEKPGKEHAA